MAEPAEVEELDVLIVGAGISGIDGAYHLQKRCPGKTYAILEGRERIGNQALMKVPVRFLVGLFGITDARRKSTHLNLRPQHRPRDREQRRELEQIQKGGMLVH